MIGNFERIFSIVGNPLFYSFYNNFNINSVWQSSMNIYKALIVEDATTAYH